MKNAESKASVRDLIAQWRKGDPDFIGPISSTRQATLNKCADQLETALVAEEVAAVEAARPQDRAERIFEAVVHTYEGDDHLVPDDLKDASFVKRARRFRETGAAKVVPLPPAWEPIDPLNIPTGRVLVTNNLEARDANGVMSHVWIGHVVRSSHTGGEFVTFDEGDRVIYGLTHWAPIPEAGKP